MSGCKELVKDKKTREMRNCYGTPVGNGDYCGIHLRKHAKPKTVPLRVLVDKYKERTKANEWCLSYENLRNCESDEKCYWNKEANECNAKRLPRELPQMVPPESKKTPSPQGSPRRSPQGSPRRSPQGSPRRSPQGSPRRSPQGSPRRSPKQTLD